MKKMLPATLMMTPKVAAIVMVSIMTGTAVPTATAQQCVTVECFHTDCHWVGPGHRRCRRICRRRCWYPPPPPRYDPPPVYDPPVYHEPVRRYAPGPRPDDAFFLGGIAFVILMALGIVAVFTESDKVKDIHKATDTALRSTDDARQLTQRGNATIEDIDRYIEEQVREAYGRGRAGEDEHG